MLDSIVARLDQLEERQFNLLSRDEIREYTEAGMITPFEPNKISSVPKKPKPFFDNKSFPLALPTLDYPMEKVISYGLGHFGYDIRIGNQFKVFQPNAAKAAYIDPKNFDESLLQEVVGDVCFIPANSYALGVSVERFDIPDDIMCLVVGKSTYARSGLIVNCTPGEPGWEGHWTLELSNAAPIPCKVYANEGIAQVLFFRGPKPSTNYANTNGKYMHQINKVVLPRV